VIRNHQVNPNGGGKLGIVCDMHELLIKFKLGAIIIKKIWDKKYFTISNGLYYPI